jgi:hypothetical protein
MSRTSAASDAGRSRAVGACVGPAAGADRWGGAVAASSGQDQAIGAGVVPERRPGAGGRRRAGRAWAAGALGHLLYTCRFRIARYL